MKTILLLTLGLMVLFVSSAWASVSQSREALITSLSGEIEVKQNPGDWQKAQAGMRLHEADSIKSGPNSAARLILSGYDEDSGELNLRENSELKFSEFKADKTTGAEKTFLNLSVGKVLVKARELGEDSQFEVATPTSIAGVWGTEFEVAVDKK